MRLAAFPLGVSGFAIGVAATERHQLRVLAVACRSELIARKIRCNLLRSI
jgi:hypothetical protein